MNWRGLLMSNYPWLNDVYDNLRQFNHVSPLSLIVTAQKGLGVDELLKLWINSLMCGKGVCGNCQNCQMLLNHSHPDYWVAKEASSISVDDIRSILNFVYLKPRSAKSRIVFLPFADKLTLQASNALLKILEEPPEYARFILLVENDSLLLPTILSRCTVFNASAIDVSMASTWLQNELNCSHQECDLRMLLSANRPLVAKTMDLSKASKFLEVCMDPFKGISDLEPAPDNILEGVHLMQIKIHLLLKDPKYLGNTGRVFLIEWYFILLKFSARLHRKVVWNKDIIWEEIFLSLRWHYCKIFNASQ
jgi:hypothetical protein